MDRLLGGKTAKALESALGIVTVGDLLRHYPRRYAERGQLTPISGLQIGEHATVVAQVRSTRKRTMRTKRGTIVEAEITDGKQTLLCTFFNQAWRERELLPGREGLFAGKVTAYRGALQLAHPEYQLFGADEYAETDPRVAAAEFASALLPVYPAAQGLPSWSIARCVRQVLDTWDGEEDPLPESLRAGHELMALPEALRRIHQPNSWADVEAARSRLKWDEALAVQLVLARMRGQAAEHEAPRCLPSSAGLAAAFDARLPFQLTEGQAEVGEEIASDLAEARPMHRLLQGEVGSGKTLVALRAMLQVIDAGRQAALLAPTEVLAAQHQHSLREFLGELAQAGELGAAEQATRVTLLTGSMPTAQRKQALLEAASGQAGIVVGTHALIQDQVSFADLGLLVVDEQHRFGVEQRDALRSRGRDGMTPHVLVMTATPIPRTVAMTVYGDLETSALRQLPSGRSPLSTSVVPAVEKPMWLDRAWARVREEVAAGRQAYVVCPKIGGEVAESTEDAADSGDDSGDSKGPGDSNKRPPLGVVETAEQLQSGELANLRVGLLHGRLSPADKETVMSGFAQGSVDVLVATTVVEVGVNVPNATVMVILDADRFGVSQLHQLRGRVGRGAHPGLCLLVTEAPAGTVTRERLEAVASTTDGFELAKLDLSLRREGDILGAAQAGRASTLKLLSLLRDEDVIAQAREEADRILAADPGLREHPGLARMLAELIDADRADYLAKS